MSTFRSVMMALHSLFLSRKVAKLRGVQWQDCHCPTVFNTSLYMCMGIPQKATGGDWAEPLQTDDSLHCYPVQGRSYCIFTLLNCRCVVVPCYTFLCELTNTHWMRNIHPHMYGHQLLYSDAESIARHCTCSARLGQPFCHIQNFSERHFWPFIRLMPG